MYTWQRGEYKSMIDLIVYDERLRELVTDTRVIRGSECGTDHFLVVSKVCLGRKWVHRKKRVNKHTRVKVERLQETGTREEYKQRLQERMNAEEDRWKNDIESRNIESAWERLKNMLLECATDVCGVAVIGKSKKSAWWNE